MLSAFPHLTSPEFETACNSLLERFQQHGQRQDHWLSTDLICQYETKYLRLAKLLPAGTRAAHRVADRSPACQVADYDIDELDELQEHDDDALQVVPRSEAIVNYDVFLSPIYRVPVLYISISDPEYRYPPTMETLYEHLILPQFKAQAESGGVIGGITIQDHPATNQPVFFIHPCQTAGVMEASAGKRDMTAEEYLILWIGALGKCVGLDVPLALMQPDQGSSINTE